MERHSFHTVSGESPNTMRKLSLSTKFQHQEIERNYGILRSVNYLSYSKDWTENYFNSWFTQLKCDPQSYFKWFAKLFLFYIVACQSYGLTNADFTAEKLKFSIQGFFSKCDQIRSSGGDC